MRLSIKVLTDEAQGFDDLSKGLRILRYLIAIQIDRL